MVAEAEARFGTHNHSCQGNRKSPSLPPRVGFRRVALRQLLPVEPPGEEGGGEGRLIARARGGSGRRAGRGTEENTGRRGGGPRAYWTGGGPRRGEPYYSLTARRSRLRAGGRGGGLWSVSYVSRSQSHFINVAGWLAKCDFATRLELTNTFCHVTSSGLISLAKNNLLEVFSCLVRLCIRVAHHEDRLPPPSVTLPGLH